VASRDPEALLRKWWRRHPYMFNEDRGIGGINHFLGSTQPVRAWYNAYLNCDGGAYRVKKGEFVPERCTGTLGSRFTWDYVRVIVSVIVVVDLRRVSGLSVGQLGDYTAMVGLAEVREDANVGAVPSILRLFSAKSGARPESLTNYDQAFLRALYSTPADDVMQKSEIELQLHRALLW